MKGRLIGVLWIVAALIVAFFVDGGFHALIWFCLLMSFAEVYVALKYHHSRVRLISKWVNRMPVIQNYLIVLAALLLLSLTEAEIMIVILVCSLSDVGAFVVGKMIGKHKVAALKRISPNKSYEGYISGALMPLAALWIVPNIFKIELSTSIIVFCVIGGLVAEIGDLIGSATKRRINVKDSAEYLSLYDGYKILEYPLKGHGGYLDRSDSLILAIICYAIIHTVASLF